MEWFGYRMKNLIINFFSLILFCSCSTRYKPEGFTGGYEQLQLSENMFRVSFRGNGYTKKQKATDFCLLRCAELTENNGFKYFSIVDQIKDTKNLAHTNPNSLATTGVVNAGGSINAYTIIYGEETYHIAKPKNSNTIICYKSKPSQGIAYSADFLTKSIGQKYGISKFQPKGVRQSIRQYQVRPAPSNTFNESSMATTGDSNDRTRYLLNKSLEEKNAGSKIQPAGVLQSGQQYQVRPAPSSNFNKSWSPTTGDREDHKRYLLRRYIQKEITRDEYFKLMKEYN